MDNTTILVIGGTGHVGGALLRRLAARGHAPHVRAMVRRPENARTPEGIEVVWGDLTDPDALIAATDGVAKVFLVWPLGGGELLTSTVELIATRVRRVVYLSAIGVRDDGAAAPDPILQFHTDVEQIVRGTDLEWTFVRSGGMATNTLGWAPQVREQSAVSWAYGDAARALVHEADLAEVAEIALTTDRLVGAAPQLTGPQTLTQSQQAAAIGRALGRDVVWRELGAGDVREALVGGGWSEAMADGALRGWAAMVERPEVPTRDFEVITGRPARSFDQWAIDHASDFR